MSAFVSESNVMLDCPATTVDEALAALAEKAVSAGLADDAAAVIDAFKAREAEGTTGLMGGFAIPHAKSAAIREAGVLVVRFPAGVSWASMDDKPITCAIALLTPAAQVGTTHLQLLSRVAVMLMDEGVRDQLDAAPDAAEIARLLNEALEKNA